MTHIELLADNAQFIPTLAKWYRIEWELYYGVDGQGDARFDLESRCNHDKLPIGLVAMSGREVQGTVALGLDESISLSPSVVGLLVAPEHRGQGIATLLIESAERLAIRLGFDQLFLSTSVLHKLLHRLGWQTYGQTQFLNEEVGSILVCDLDRRR